ncbi:MAG TPA: LysR substrate-binding domain-containing protein, partial [Terrimicrobiaceae bacterium]|nr:LysR substrate-binding domain-containing protein [Terrimicrobiaceae bacterium]
RPRIVLEADRAQAVAVLVAAGTGVALLPESLSRVAGDAAAVRALRKPPILAHAFARPSGPKAPAMQAFLAVLQQLARDGTPGRPEVSRGG